MFLKISRFNKKNWIKTMLIHAIKISFSLTEYEILYIKIHIRSVSNFIVYQEALFLEE